MRQQKWTVLLIILILLNLVTAPILYTGYSDIRRAESAWENQDFSNSAEYYLHAIKFQPWRKDLWEKAGLAKSGAADYKDAILYLNRAPQLSERGWAALGLSYIQMGDYSSAINAYQQGLKIYDSSSLYAGLAYIYREQKNWQAESEALKNQSRLEMDNVYVHYRLGLLLTFLEPEDSLSHLMRASSLDPKTDSAVQTIRAALNLSATQADPSEKMVTVGRALGLVQDWELAVSTFDKAIQIDSENAEAWAWLGEAKQHTGQDGRAELDQALSLGDSSVVVHALRGLYWSRKNEFAKMLVEYQQAAQLEPDNPEWQAGIGNAYSKKGDLVAAFTAFQQATDLAPEDSTYWRLLAVFCAQNGVHLEDSGLAAAQKAVELSPNDPLVLDALGFSYFSSGRYASAEQVLLDAIDLFPDHLPLYIHLAMTYLAQGNQSGAFNALVFVRDTDLDGSDGLFAKDLLTRYFP